MLRTATSFIVGLLLLVLASASASAQLPSAETRSYAPVPSKKSANQASVKNCNVGVRLIRGMSGEGAQHLERQLRDLKDQLDSLPFSRFEVLQRKQATRQLHEQAEFRVVDAANRSHLVKVVPYSMMSNRVHVGVDWQGPEGETIVATKFKVENGQSMVWGADGAGGESTLLCVKVHCR